MDKPLTVRYMEFKQSLISLINNAGIPLFIVRYVLAEALEMVDKVSSNEIKRDLEEYGKAKEEEENGNTDDE